MKLLSQLVIAGLIATTATTGFAQEQNIAENATTSEVVEATQSEEATKAVKVEKQNAQDILTIKGLVRYDIRRDNPTGKKHETKKSLLRTRLEPTLNLGNGWKIKNRMDYDINYKDRDKDHFYNRMLYLQGPAFGGTISLGKVDYADFANMDIAYGMVYDDYIKGGKFVYTDSKTKAIYTTAIGNFDSPYNASSNGSMANYPQTDAMHYVGLQAEYPASSKLNTGIAYHNIRSGELDETQQIFELAGEYKFDSNVKLGGAYAVSTLDHADYGLKTSGQENAYVVQLNYKGAKRTVPNTFGVYAAYKNLGQLAAFVPTYTNAFVGEQGYEIGTKYVFAPNFTGEVSYFNGQSIDNHSKDKTRWFGRLEYRF